MEILESFFLCSMVAICIDIGCTMVEYANDIWKMNKK